MMQIAIVPICSRSRKIQEVDDEACNTLVEYIDASSVLNHKSNLKCFIR
jgi:hypothetical protein